jgi:glycolate oxidase FAD binding subunit
MTTATNSDVSDVDVKEWHFCHSSWHGQMQRISRQNPEQLVIPVSRAALCAVVRQAQREQKRLIPCGNGTKLAWGGLTTGADWLVSTQKLNRIVEHAVDDLTITVEAGLTFGALQAYLQSYQQFLPLDPAFPEQATLGGIVATADAGSLRQRYGGVRDLLLGITVVRADGEVAKAGGKVVKNVAGYDLMKLFTGSYGSLAVITELTFRLYPLQEQSITVLIAGDRPKISQVQARLINSVLTPAAADLLSPQLMQTLQLGDAEKYTEQFGLLIRFQAIQESITAQLKELEAIAQQFAIEITPQPETLWQNIGDRLYAAPVIAKFGILPNQNIALLAKVEQLTNGQAIGRCHSKSGLGVITFPHSKFLRQFREIREFCQQNQGFFTILDAPYSLKTQFEPWGYQSNALPLMQKIKQQFDPHSLFSPGRFVGKI